MQTRTRFLFLMSPLEFKVTKANTGRLLDDPRNHCVLLYPGKTATNLSDPAQVPALGAQLDGRRLVVVLIDATWRGARKIHRLSPSLQRLPRIKFTPTMPSRYVIKKQPRADCLSTLEAVHELLLVLERAGLDNYPLPGQLHDVFQRMQDFQIKCASAPDRQGYRHLRPMDRVGPSDGRR